MHRGQQFHAVRGLEAIHQRGDTGDPGQGFAGRFQPVGGEGFRVTDQFNDAVRLGAVTIAANEVPFQGFQHFVEIGRVRAVVSGFVVQP
jgi:hypothetical protein